MKILIKTLLLIPGLFLFSRLACSPEPVDTVFPSAEWEQRTPESQGVDSAGLQKALAFLESKCLHNGIKEVVIIRNGYLIYSGDQIDSVHNIWSCSKTFTSTVLGLLVDDQMVSLNDYAASYEPLLQELYPQVTFRHFTSMTSGYSAEGISRWNQENADWSWTPYQPAVPYFAPGTQFAYWDEAQMMFGRVLTQVLKRPMQDFLTERVTNPIGLGQWFWYPEGELNGIPINNGCTNVHINAKQLARWGWLFLNKGNWNGQQLISEKWVKMATTVQVPNTIPVADTDRKNIVGSGCYGFNWWINGIKPDGRRVMPGAPAEIFWASGHNHNKCFVIPSWKMVVVRMGEDGAPPDVNEIWSEFFDLVGKALEKGG